MKVNGCVTTQDFQQLSHPETNNYYKNVYNISLIMDTNLNLNYYYSYF